MKRDESNPKETIRANDELLSKSKERRGWGYTVHREQVASLSFGNNLFPTAITIDTLEDLLRLANKLDEFAATEEVVRKIREAFPSLEDWLQKIGEVSKSDLPMLRRLDSCRQLFRRESVAAPVRSADFQSNVRHQICVAERKGPPAMARPLASTFGD